MSTEIYDPKITLKKPFDIEPRQCTNFKKGCMIDIGINQIQLEEYVSGDGGGLTLYEKGTLKKDSLILVNKVTKVSHLYIKVDTPNSIKNLKPDW